MDIAGQLDIKAYMREQATMIERLLEHSLPADWDIPQKLRESMRYSLLAGGKRLRPILTMAAAQSLGASADGAALVGAALELIHTYSLVHDDLPTMDNDDLRRGKPTNHVVYGEAMALLAGDGLLTHAFYMVSKAGHDGLIAPERALRIVGELAMYAGPRGMVGGQAADMLGEQGITSLAELEYIHAHKTGDLIVCALRAGGHAANADELQLAALEKFGRSIGLAFQIQDDILDVTGDRGKLGKPLGSDVEAGKVTYPYLLGLDACRAKVAELTAEAKQALYDGQFSQPEPLAALADYMMKREH